MDHIEYMKMIGERGGSKMTPKKKTAVLKNLKKARVALAAKKKKGEENGL